MYSCQRKTAPRVVGGRVLRKNNHELTTAFDRPFVTRERPGRGYKHVLAQRDVHAFLEILPGWRELSRGLSAIVLAAGESGMDGRLRGGVIELCAWETELVRVHTKSYFEEHRGVLERLGVPHEPAEPGWVTCHYDEQTARGFQLVHILLHELGHHHDSMTTRSRRGNRGEAYAEAFARERETLVWERYVQTMR